MKTQTEEIKWIPSNGEKFGELTVIDNKPVILPNGRTERILVECSCGVQYHASLATLANRRQRRCGSCHAQPKHGGIERRGRPQLAPPNIGEKFGQLTILDNRVVVLPHRKESRIFVECSCGNQYYAYLSALLSGRQKRCSKCRIYASGLRLVEFNKNQFLLKQKNKV